MAVKLEKICLWWKLFKGDGTSGENVRIFSEKYPGKIKAEKCLRCKGYNEACKDVVPYEPKYKN